jgi:phosphoesterase RecJ-like protein
MDFIDRHSSIILTTHEGADADGLGAEIICSRILRGRDKSFRILNSAPPAERFAFIDREGLVETWNREPGLPEEDRPVQPGLLSQDTADEYHLGPLRDLIPLAREIFAVDHHEPNPLSAISGYIDPAASSTCEMVAEIALETGVALDRDAAQAAFAGISFDSGSFAYSKTGARTFRIAQALVEAGASPPEIHELLNENSTRGALVLQKRVFSTLEILGQGRIAVQILRREDLEATGAHLEDVESFINLPLRCQDIQASVMIKETREGYLHCSLRSRGSLNVARIAREFGGGGHAGAAGFKISAGIEEISGRILERLEKGLEGNGAKTG